jgi:hypothetical protein
MASSKLEDAPLDTVSRQPFVGGQVCDLKSSKAVGIKPTALPCPLRAVFSDDIVRVSKLVVKSAAAIFTSVPARAGPPACPKGRPSPTNEQ